MMTLYLVVTQHEDILVGQEHLEGVDSLLFGQHLDLLPHLLTPPGHAHVEGVVAADLGVRPRPPAVVLLQQRLILWPQNEVHYILIALCVFVLLFVVVY